MLKQCMLSITRMDHHRIVTSIRFLFRKSYLSYNPASFKRSFSISNICQIESQSAIAEELVIRSLENDLEGIKVLALNRPHVKNAFNANLTNALHDACEQLCEDKTA